MPEPAEDMIVRNLLEALERLHEDLDRVERWTAALGCFQAPGAPMIQPGERYLFVRRSNRDAQQPLPRGCDPPALDVAA